MYAYNTILRHGEEASQILIQWTNIPLEESTREYQDELCKLFQESPCGLGDFTKNGYSQSHIKAQSTEERTSPRKGIFFSEKSSPFS